MFQEYKSNKEASFLLVVCVYSSVGSETIGAIWLRVRECQLLAAFAVVDND